MRPLPNHLILFPQETLRLLPHSIYCAENIVMTCATPQNESFTFMSETVLPPFSLFLPLMTYPFVSSFYVRPVPGAQSVTGTKGSITRCSIAGAVVFDWEAFKNIS